MALPLPAAAAAIERFTSEALAALDLQTASPRADSEHPEAEGSSGCGANKRACSDGSSWSEQELTDVRLALALFTDDDATDGELPLIDSAAAQRRLTLTRAQTADALAHSLKRDYTLATFNADTAPPELVRAALGLARLSPRAEDTAVSAQPASTVSPPATTTMAAHFVSAMDALQRPAQEWLGAHVLLGVTFRALPLEVVAQGLRKALPHLSAALAAPVLTPPPPAATALPHLRLSAEEAVLDATADAVRTQIVLLRVHARNIAAVCDKPCTRSTNGVGAAQHPCAAAPTPAEGDAARTAGLHELQRMCVAVPAANAHVFGAAAAYACARTAGRAAALAAVESQLRGSLAATPGLAGLAEGVAALTGIAAHALASLPTAVRAVAHGPVADADAQTGSCRLGQVRLPARGRARRVWPTLRAQPAVRRARRRCFCATDCYSMRRS